MRRQHNLNIYVDDDDWTAIQKMLDGKSATTYFLELVHRPTGEDASFGAVDKPAAFGPVPDEPPLPPDVLASASTDRIHRDVGRGRVAPVSTSPRPQVKTREVTKSRPTKEPAPVEKDKSSETDKESAEILLPGETAADFTIRRMHAGLTPVPYARYLQLRDGPKDHSKVHKESVDELLEDFSLE